MFDKKKVRNRLKVAAYILIAALAIIFFLIAILYFKSNEVYKSIFLNLATDFVGAFLFFVILQFFLSDPDDVISEKLESMLALQNAKAEFQTQESSAFDEFFKNLKDKKITHVDLIGYSMAHVFQRYKNEIIEFVDGGAKIRVLVLNPDSTAGKLMIETVGEPELVYEPHQRTMRYIKNINMAIQQLPRHKNIIEVRKISWVPSSTVAMARGGNRFFSVLVGINGFILDNSINRRLYTITAFNYKDEKYSFFESHFDRLWETSKDEGKSLN
jgi:hypothetical protein